jgi:hypothetical protein
MPGARRGGAEEKRGLAKWSREVRRVLWTLRPRRGRIVTRAQPRRPHPLPAFRLYAVLGTWMEADVVEACVRNAFTQGCERVFLVDNDSPDDTVPRALAAGAELAVSFTTAIFDEAMRISLMNGVARQVTGAGDDAHVWWLFLDADEFPHGPAGRTLREFLTPLDRCFRTVGTHYFDHYPSPGTVYVPGTHPLDAMPLCALRAQGRCEGRHTKHPLLRFDRGAARIEASGGFHNALSRAAVLEPEDGIFEHHFPFRAEDVTRARLAALWTPAPGGGARAAYQDAHERREWGRGSLAMRRWETLDVVYGRAPDAEGMLAACRAWPQQVDPVDARFARW